eukprot:CAMPEP_0202917890 /NCGR_PEP_ID=MMETSP1392-20130828/72093_1 /ASSEMBLY_ACC=CAM_ASM_000868 /TAXON_ID=225041 /ORGANISM="Chlamydomonas chlamydogama, Strain SAG 11-48b" /LENGTH=129 /DNA_ID=CAMNT_0049610779 /DNA_START=148 /DNA_END=537 /DNA_ORIENTATION=+
MYQQSLSNIWDLCCSGPGHVALSQHLSALLHNQDGVLRLGCEGSVCCHGGPTVLPPGHTSGGAARNHQHGLDGEGLVGGHGALGEQGFQQPVTPVVQDVWPSMEVPANTMSHKLSDQAHAILVSYILDS